MTTALYRRYRPDAFETVIGQEHVTEPLMTALQKNRVNHAYLFSGPRGCGKTTSARILARCLNCAQGPTPHPCGTCESCVELATGGSGSLDVIEIDAASHGGVDDARDLRERATFAPARDRYKIFIIDEAHMVTSAGFNALLKIVEEPPEHIKFIFATTEPDKVIGTIRSRTHHYPFRLVPPEPLMNYLEQLCAQENVEVAPGVLSLVVRAGGGSVRDTLSVLDQLMAGAGNQGVSYDLAVNLLGFTPESLLDDVVDAVTATDSETVFRVVDRVVQSGQDPRRFVEDLLERFRDLIIAKAMPDSAQAVLHGIPEDQLRRLHTQASPLGRAEISRAADITALALTEMSGATSPRLHLELLMARLMLPSTDETERGLAARLDRIERRLDYGGAPTSAPAASTGQAPAPASAADQQGLSGAALARAAVRRDAAPAPTPEPAQPEPAQQQQPQQSQPQPVQQPPAQQTQPQQPSQPAAPAPQQREQPSPQEQPAPQQRERPAPTPEPQRPAQPQSPSEPQAQPEPQQQPAPQAEPTQEAPQGSSQQGSSQLDMVRRAWPEVISYLEQNSRLIWMTIKDNASVAGFDGQLLTLSFSNDGPRKTVMARGGEQIISEALNQVLGIRPQLDLITGGSAPAGGSGPKAASRPAAAPASPATPSRPAAEPTPAPQPESKPEPKPEPTPEPRPEPTPAPRPTSAPEPAPQSEPAPAPQQHAPQQHAPQQHAPQQQPQPQRGPRPDEEPYPFEPPEDESWLPEDDEFPGIPDFTQTEEFAASTAAEQQRASAPQGLSAPDAAPAEPARATDPTPPAESPTPAETPSPEPEPVAEDGFAGFIPRTDPSEASIPVFAKSEAELRAEFSQRFGSTIPTSAASVVTGDGANTPPRSEPSAESAPAPTEEPQHHSLATTDAHSAAPAPESPVVPRPAPTSRPAPEPTPHTEPASEAAPNTDTPHQRKASRFQQMMEQYRTGNTASAQNGSSPGAPTAPNGGAPRPEASTAVHWDEEIPSDEDETIESSGLAGRAVVERLLNARLIDERNPDGSPKI
ncbi:DNA polymerase III subunit gamma and tau [Citricoccus muralis]|uniref:DNA-directed DNA polymerase n=1 Tax=Citricoccus muralis TaxID=169134 RepID=A0ABY8H8Q0_9MICC|nr:DNA polymerase III subunit gamma and tau [Citricoccus muralis]WFP17080.1 DNA polymerase III subunit gamma and tau [Citricoccus muralis]